MKNLNKINWNNQSELESLLPKYKPIKAYGSIDRYGFLSILADICEIKKAPRPFAEWIHGWMWDEHPSPDSMGLSSLTKSVPVVVRNYNEYMGLITSGFKEVIIGGLPFAYIKKQHDSRNDFSLLSFPPHSAEFEKINNNQEEYIDYLYSIKNDFDGIYLSIYHLDLDGPMHKAAKARGIKIIQGANPNDENSLYRMRSILDSFQYVTTNNLGSHFIYALYAGCKVSISGPMYSHDRNVFLGNGNRSKHSEKRVNRLIEIQSESYIRKRYGDYFFKHPINGICNFNFGANEIGINQVLSSKEIIKVLGWNATGQLRGYFRGAINNIKYLHKNVNKLK